MVAEARAVLSDLYLIMSELSDSGVIVDSSKHPSWAYLLAGIDSIDLRLVHLVRHPSAVVFSWSTPVARPQAVSGTGDRIMPAHSTTEVSLRWDVTNLLLARLRRRRIPHLLLRYEDYVVDLDRTIRDCLDLVDLGCVRTPSHGMGTDHGVAGNPSRFADEDQPIVVDDRWIASMSRPRHFLVSGLTWPVRKRYGYRYRREDPVGQLRRAPLG